MRGPRGVARSGATRLLSDSGATCLLSDSGVIRLLSDSGAIRLAFAPVRGGCPGSAVGRETVWGRFLDRARMKGIWWMPWH